MANKIRVLHVVGSFNVGGMEAHLLNFFNHTDFDRYEHFLFVSSDEGQLREQFHQLPVIIKALKCSPGRYFYNIPYGLDFCRKHRIDILHGHNYWSYLYCYFLSIVTGIPFLTTDYGLGTWKKKIHRAWESRVFRRARMNLALSSAILQKDRSLVGGEHGGADNFDIVYPIIRSISRDVLHDDEKQAIKDKLGIDNDKPVLTIIGRIIKLKGHRFGIEAADRINQSEPRVNLLIVGRLDDPEVLSAEDMRKDYIIYKNFYEHIEDIWTVTDLFLIPSTSEGTPLVLLEYFALGKPVIASDISGNRDLVKDGWNGFLFESENVTELVEKIETAIGFADPDTLRENTIKFYKETLSPSIHTGKIEGYYAEYARKD